MFLVFRYSFGVFLMPINVYRVEATMAKYVFEGQVAAIKEGAKSVPKQMRIPLDICLIKRFLYRMAQPVLSVRE